MDGLRRSLRAGGIDCGRKKPPTAPIFPQNVKNKALDQSGEISGRDTGLNVFLTSLFRRQHEVIDPGEEAAGFFVLAGDFEHQLVVAFFEFGNAYDMIDGNDAVGVV